MNCPLCNVGILTEHRSKEMVSGSGKIVEVEYSVCNVCKEEVILTDQIKRNDIRFLDSTKPVL